MQTSKNSVALIFLAVIVLLIAGFATYSLYLSPNKTASEEDLSLKVATTTVDIPVPNINGSEKPMTKLPAEASPTPLPTELKADSWKTYQNATYNFKVDYPTGWTVGSNVFDTRGSLLAISFCPPSFAANGDCKYSKTDKHSYAPFLLYVSKTADKTGGNKVVWNHGGLVYELRQNDDRFAELYEQIIVTLKFLK